jgi:hypothetical protein
VFICPYLRLKKEKFLTADDNGLMGIHADAENRNLNNIVSGCIGIIKSSQPLTLNHSVFRPARQQSTVNNHGGCNRNWYNSDANRFDIITENLILMHNLFPGASVGRL